jgi:hypothetical protein
VSETAAASATEYQACKESGVCTRPGCRRRASDESSMCKRHHREAKRHSRESKQRQRDARRAAGQCIWCPGDRPAPATPGSTSCLGCRVRRNRIRAADGGVKQGVNTDAAIAARTRTGADGRTRYHGQGKRGQQPKAQLNHQDVRHARQDFDGFEAGVLLMASPQAETWSRGERERIEIATATLGNRATGRIDDVLERLGHFKMRHGRRDGE